MIDDGYPIFDKEEWKAAPGAQAGALILDYSITKNGKKYWVCHCLACGKEGVEKRQDNLFAGAMGGIVYSSGRTNKGTRSCGCKQKKQFKNPNTLGKIDEDLTGQILEGWKLIEKTSLLDSNRSFYYLCQSTINPNYYDLLSIRHLKDGWSAKAINANKKYTELQNSILNFEFKKPKMSKGEEQIYSLLKINNIHGCWQYRFANCKDSLPLPFDFFIQNKYIIEYDGKQHFKQIPFFDKIEESFFIRRSHDLLKNRYCFKNKIPIIRIPYNAIFDINDLKPETTRYLLTPENEARYYLSQD